MAPAKAHKRRHDNAAKAREKLALVKRRKLMAKMNLDGWTRAEIAAELKVDGSTVSRELKALRLEWAVEHKASTNEHVQRELASLLRDEKDVRARLESVDGEDENRDAAKWHEVLLKIREARRKLLGLDAPVKVDMRADVVAVETRALVDALGDDPKARALCDELASRIYATAPKPEATRTLTLDAVVVTKATNGNGNGVSHA